MKMNVVDYVKFEKSILEQNVNIEVFFREFSKYYVKSPVDFLSIAKDFYFTIEQIKKDLQFNDRTEKFAFNQQIKTFCRNINQTLNPNSFCLDKQAPYVNLLSKLISSNNKILDVGSGQMPYSSILLKDYFNKVGSIDKFILDEKALKTTNIDAENNYFNQNTQIDEYDFVVGSRPCSAIKSIVENCSNNNKGYFIRLCDCDLYRLANENNGVLLYWHQILPSIDKNINFSENYEYAYNLDINKEQFSKIEQESQKITSNDLTNSVFNEVKNYASEHPIDIIAEINKNPQAFTQE